ncbi:MAG TPA: patatin-like phospholipase family protein [Planctomycetota bacterium]|nr:patatin-like phospholipase family protein [Planctomycetota bacterium]
MSTKPRIALALSGGGAKGAFTVGVLRALDQLFDPFPYPVISGTSTGSLVGTLIATNELAKLVTIYSSVQTKNIVNPNHALVASVLGTEAVLFAAAVLGGRSIFDTKALRETIANNTDFAKVKASKTLLIYNAVDLQTGALRWFDNRTHPPAVLADALLASANMPVLMDPVDLPVGGEMHQFVDGGVREYLPLRALFAADVEYDLIIAVATSPTTMQREGHPIDKITKILGRTIQVFDHEVSTDDYMGAQLYNAILRIVENAKRKKIELSEILAGIPDEVRSKLKGKVDAPLLLITPDTELDMDSLEFEPEKMRRAMAHGTEVVKRRGDEIRRALGI